jgi:hypothetical protein
MLDYEVPIVLREACRVACGAFVLLVEITEPGYLHGTYGVKKLTKGRTIDEYASMMHPYHLCYPVPSDFFERPDGTLKSNLTGSSPILAPVCHCPPIPG